jgi:Spy/CpxP family protein refolding chaperone
MKASVLTLALLCAGAVFAQTPPPEAAHAARHMDDLATLLDLTDAQKAQVEAILQEQHARMRQSFEQARASGAKPGVEQMHALHQQLQQETLQKLTPVLSAVQLKKFQILSQRMHGMHGHFVHGGPGQGAAEGAAPPGQN